MVETTADQKVEKNHQFENELSSWIKKEKAALELIKIVGDLWFDKSVEIILFRRSIIDTRPSEVLNDHLYAKNYVNQPLTVYLSLELVKAASKLDLCPSRIDLGRLASEYINEKENYDSTTDFVEDKLSDHIGQDKLKLTPKDVVLYGFGRIGRLAARALISQAGKGEQLRLKAIVTRDNSDEQITKRAALLRKDSIHGKMRGTVKADLDNKAIIVNGHTIYMIAASLPEDIDYESYGIHDALVIDNTGVWRDEEGLSRHLNANGVSKVLLTAPGKGNIPNIVHGVNHEQFMDHSNPIFSAASCTTNAIVPVLKVINDKLGVECGHVETVHSYTNDQNLLDNYHKKYRRGRSAAINMVITETGAAKAVAKVLPELGGKLTGNAVRVPTPNVSLAILNLTLNNETTVDDLNNILKQAALSRELVEQIDYSTSQEFVSTDAIGNPHASVVDAPATIVSEDGKHVVLYVWYDNEYGYTRQVVRLAKHLAKVIRLRYY